MEKQKLLRLLTLDKCLRNEYRWMSMAELLRACNKALDSKGFAKVSERTVREDFRTIDMEYDVKILKELRGHTAYFRYEDTTYSIAQQILPEEANSTLKKAIEVLDELGDSPHVLWVKTLLRQITLEAPYAKIGNIQFQNNLDLAGLNFFNDLARYIVNKRAIRLTYKAYGKEEQTCIMHPYLLKQYNDRWYLVGQNDGYETFSNRAIDRIVKVEEANVEYKGTGVDFEEYYEYTIGVTIEPGDPVEDIVLKVDPQRYNYIRSKPLHWTQTELHELSDDDHKYVRLKLRVNRELTALLLSYGRDVEVVSPATLREMMGLMVEDMAGLYRK